MLKAFTYMFKDNMFIKKIIPYYVIVFFYLFFNQTQTLLSTPVPNLKTILSLFLCLILSIIVFMFMTGYIANSIKALTIQNENNILPFFSINKVFKTGAKYWLANFLFGIAIALVFIVILILSVIIAALVTSHSTNPLLAKEVAILTLLITSFLPLIAIGIYMLPFNWIFANSENIFSFFRFKLATILIAKNAKTIFIALLFTVITLIVGGIFTFITTVVTQTIHNYFVTIITCLISAIVLTYTGLVGMFLTAKSISSDDLEMLK